NLGDTLKVEVVFGDQKSDMLALEPAFDVEEGFGTPGGYQASLIPTRPGTYTFHFVGSVKGQKVDQTFTSSEKTFDSPHAPSEVEFPAQDPSTADLASRLDRLSPRVDTAPAAPDRCGPAGESAAPARAAPEGHLHRHMAGRIESGRPCDRRRIRLRHRHRAGWDHSPAGRPSPVRPGCRRAVDLLCRLECID